MDFPPPPPFPGAEDTDTPPPYVDVNQGDGQAISSAIANTSSEAEEEIVQPVILVLSKRFIHAQSSSGGGSTGSGTRAPLYELSHDITQSSDGETKAELSRMVPSVRTSLIGGGGIGVPRIAHRSSHIYDLKRLPALIADGFPYRLDAVSRRNRRWSSSAAAEVSGGKLGLKTSSFPRAAGVVKFVRIGSGGGNESYFPKGYKAMRRTSLSGGRGSGGGQSSVFEWRKARDHCEWIGPGGNRIAVEDDSATAAPTDGDDDNDGYDSGQLKLIVTAPLPRTTMDALVASWCLKTWRDRIEHSIRNPYGCELRLSFHYLQKACDLY